MGIWNIVLVSLLQLIFPQDLGLLSECERSGRSDINQLNAWGLILAHMMPDIAPRAVHAYPVCNGSNASMVWWRNVIYVAVYGKKGTSLMSLGWRNAGFFSFLLCFFWSELKAALLSDASEIQTKDISPNIWHRAFKRCIVSVRLWYATPTNFPICIVTRFMKQWFFRI